MDRTVFIYRVHRRKAECVWAGRIAPGPYPLLLNGLLDNYIVLPKQFAHNLASEIWPYGDSAAKIIEAYPMSVNHACIQEMGIGLSLGHEKWTKYWPQVSWEILDRLWDVGTGSAYETIRHEWSMEQLASAKLNRKRMPYGMDKEAWDMLGDLRIKKARQGALRSK